MSMLVHVDGVIVFATEAVAQLVGLDLDHLLEHHHRRAGVEVAG